MKNAATLFWLIGVLVFNGGCASTKITSFTDPDYRQTTFQKILVVVNTSDLERRLYFESRMAKVLRDTGVAAIEGFNLFPPTRNLTPERKVEVLIQDSIDSYLDISVGESGVEQIYIPPTGSTTTTKGNASIVGNQLNYEEKSKTTIQGGYTFSKPWASFEISLIDVSTGNKAWIASGFTGGNAFADFNTVINSFCDQTVNQLARDRLIRPREHVRQDNEKRRGSKEELVLNQKVSDRDSLDQQHAIEDVPHYLPPSQRHFVKITTVNGAEFEVYLAGESTLRYFFSKSPSDTLYSTTTKISLRSIAPVK